MDVHRAPRRARIVTTVAIAQGTDRGLAIRREKKGGRSPLSSSEGQAFDQVAIVQVAESLLQVVFLSPGEAGVKLVLPEVVVGAVAPVQARFCGVGTVMPGVCRAATAEFM